MTTSCLRSALLTFALLFGGSEVLTADSSSEKKVTRPEIASLTFTLDDGRSYSLKNSELKEAKGGAIFWGDWAVTNLLVPFNFLSRDSEANPYAVIQYWWTPGHSGELPAFILNTPKGPSYPLDPGGPAPWARPFQSAHRPRVIQILASYKDGRTCSFSELTLRDEKSGVMVWNDFAVENLLVPFYAAGKSAITTASDVVRTWNTPTTALPSGNTRAAIPDELPGFLVKPRCIPSYPGPE